jgi:hypothetical protein
MKIISIDVGIKNLAFCLFDIQPPSPTILKWNIIDLTQDSSAPHHTNYCQQPVPASKNKKEIKYCTKLAKYIYCEKYYCVCHAKKSGIIVPSNKTTPSAINKLKVHLLHDLALKYKLTPPPNIKKPEIVGLLNEFINKNSFSNISSTIPINASKLDLVTIGRNIQIKFNEMLHDIDISSIGTVIIENQISPIANRMKTIQGMIAQYFIMTNNNIKIDFVSASNKLKTGSNDNTTTYKNRKLLGIQICLEHIIHDLPWHTFFISHNKKDDLADSFLQGLWYINNKISTP